MLFKYLKGQFISISEKHLPVVGTWLKVNDEKKAYERNQVTIVSPKRAKKRCMLRVKSDESYKFLFSLN